MLAPTHELTISHAILRARRRIADADPVWAVSGPGVSALAGLTGGLDLAAENDQGPSDDDGEDFFLDGEEALSAEFAAIDAVLERSRRFLEGEGAPAVNIERRQSVVVGDLVVRDAEWDERDRIEQWHAVSREVEDMPPTLAAAVLWDAWETLEPLQNKHWLGPLLVGA